MAARSDETMAASWVALMVADLVVLMALRLAERMAATKDDQLAEKKVAGSAAPMAA